MRISLFFQFFYSTPSWWTQCVPMTVRWLVCKFGCWGSIWYFYPCIIWDYIFFEDIFDYNIYWHCDCICSFLGLHIYGCILEWYLRFLPNCISKNIFRIEAWRWVYKKKPKHVADLISFYVIKVVLDWKLVHILLVDVYLLPAKDIRCTSTKHGLHSFNFVPKLWTSELYCQARKP